MNYNPFGLLQIKVKISVYNQNRRILLVFLIFICNARSPKLTLLLSKTYGDSTVSFKIRCENYSVVCVWITTEYVFWPPMNKQLENTSVFFRWSYKFYVMFQLALFCAEIMRDPNSCTVNFTNLQ